MEKSAVKNVKIVCGCIVVLASLFSGCRRAPYDLAPISGVVTLDGKPVEQAIVRFELVPGQDCPSGPGSIGLTSSDGRYSLKTHKGERGAVIGSHRVSISTKVTRMINPDLSDATEVVAKERIPSRYWHRSELVFDVSPKGTKEADFDLSKN